MITHNGVTMSLSAWAKQTEQTPQRLHYRLGHWPIDKALIKEKAVAIKHPLYTTWCGMRSRCNNPNSFGYPWYGARGIKVCAEWDDFWQFAADMGERPYGCTLDRKDNDKGYSNENCRWATRGEQVTNRRCTLERWTEKNESENLRRA